MQTIAAEQALNLARERYRDLVQMQRVDWTSPRAKALAAQVDFEAARLLEQQVTTGRDSFKGRFRKKPVEDFDALIQAHAETTRAISALSLAFACPGSRFYHSARVADSIGLADDFLRRAQEMALPLTPFGTTPPRVQEDPRSVIEWLWRCGGAESARDTEYAFKKAFARLRSDRRGPIVLDTDDPPFTAFLAAMYFKDAPLAQRARAGLASLLKTTLQPDGSLLNQRQLFDVLYAGGIVRDAALYDYLTRDTMLSLDRDTMSAVSRCLTRFISQATYEGEPDALAVHPSSLGRFKDRRQAFAGMVWSAALVMLASSAGEPAPAAAQRPELRQALQALRAQYRPLLNESAYSEATPVLLELNTLDRQTPGATTARKAPLPQVTYFPCAGYLVARQGDFYASVRLPFPELSASKSVASDAKLLGAMNLLSDTFNPNAAFLGPRAHWALPGCTMCDALLPDSGLLSPKTVADSSILGGAILDNGAVAAASLVAHRENVVVRANRSWFVFEDRVVAAGTGISASTTDIANQGWAASPGDRLPWLAIDLGQPTVINRVRVHFRVKGGVYTCVPREIIFQVSLDGQKWQDVRSLTNLPASGTQPQGYVKAGLYKSSARYFRLFFPEGADGETIQISDVQLFHVDRREDEQRIGRDLPNLASFRRGARAFASSFASESDRPDQALTGRGEPGTSPLPVKTCLLVMNPKDGPIVANDGEIKNISIPEKRKETRLQHVHWVNCASVGCLFQKPVNLIVKRETEAECILFIDHAGTDSFCVSYLPNQKPEETARCEDAALVEFKMDSEMHRVFDKASNLTAVAMFSPREKGDVITGDTGCVLYKIEGEKLACGLSSRLVRNGVSIRAPGIEEVSVNGKAIPLRSKDDLVILSGK
jgi:hypothetical protein